MNKIDFQQTGGFPLETDTLDAMQTAYNIFNSLGNIIAPLAIISGCDQIGNQISNGIVYINGEVIEFRGGTPTQFVIIGEDVKNRLFYEETKEKPVYRTRYATFGESAANENYKWNDFHRFKNLQKLEAEKAEKVILDNIVARVQKLEVFARPFSGGGGMVFFNRPINEIPEGWREVVNWRGRIPMHINPDDADFDSIGKLFGEKARTITTANLPRNKYGTNFGAEIKSDGLAKFTSGYGKGDDIYLGNNEAFSIIPPVKIALFIEPIP